ncbi:unnamed protein product [Rhizophagus irregularis]|nr:unnamed protein product [Rhizophagus irregularis]
MQQILNFSLHYDRDTLLFAIYLLLEQLDNVERQREKHEFHNGQFQKSLVQFQVHKASESFIPDRATKQLSQFIISYDINFSRYRYLKISFI